SILNDLKTYIAKNAPPLEKDLLTHLVDYYYNIAVSREELSERALPDLYARFYSHFQFMKKRQEGQIKLSVFNPKLTDDGFASPHTIIQICQDDMPFLVDSMLMELNRQSVAVHFIVHNGAVHTRRDAQGEINEFVSSHALSEDVIIEANAYIEVDHQHDETALMALQDGLFSVLSDVGLAVDDFLEMRTKMQNHAQALKTEKAKPVADFLHWLVSDHFTFLGYARFNHFKKTPETALGLMKDQSSYGMHCFADEFKALPVELQNQEMVVTKSSYLSTVHRPIYLDAILIPEFDQNGQWIGESRFLGLFTSSAYHSRAVDIPHLQDKVKNVFKRAHFARHGHDFKALEDIIESFPKDELFQMTEDQIFDPATRILYIQERQQIRLFLRKDLFGRFYNCMVYLPRDLYNTELRLKFQNILMHELHGETATHTPRFLASVLCRIDFVIRVKEGEPASVDLSAIEAQLRLVARNWREDLRDMMVEKIGEHKTTFIYNKYARAFPSNYCDDFTVTEAYRDISRIEELDQGEVDLIIDFERDELQSNLLHFKAMQRHHGLWLTHILPILENFGLQVIEERPYEVRLPDNLSVWISDFLIDGADLDAHFDSVKALFKEAFLEVWHKRAENDRFNRLTLQIGLAAREVVLLRAVAKYLAQLGFLYSQQYIEDTLGRYPELTRALVDLFITKFNPSLSHAARNKTTEIQQQFELGLKKVSSLDHDRILRRFKEVIKAMMRTNYFQKDEGGAFKSYVSFKVDCHLISDIPKPIPMAGIFVYAPEVEGIHLRGAKVARGGIRWSDRREDFRTEVLGLMKAQQVKNAVIVPLGAKGGFCPKNLPFSEGRDAVQAEAIRCYKIYIASLLDLTDNIVKGKVVPPENVVRYDEDDPYLVVAADKGTASFSDIANQVAAEYHFWLGDAFASGGSNGYDHKKMAITARGAWESVKRHFLYLSRDIQSKDFTVVGIGDMSGDVFGNGMLLSKHIQLVAAFNHMHIFLDPQPNIVTSFEERQRLFQLPRSAWSDYNPALLSQGGGVFERSLKTISITPEVQTALGITETELEPNELIKAILKAPVDLLWNGGIGTYVKASSQNHFDVGDRTNDILRINANELRCKVVGEGGNLGFTQLARVEYALADGQICTDAIDNSAGVDCSDHEVNIKILLNAVVADEKLTLDERNHLLAQMEKEVGSLVLSDNYHQTQAISNGVQQMSAVTTYIRLLRELEREGFISRSLEALPSDKILKSRASQGKSFTKPEFSVLMAYAKTTIKDILLRSDFPEEPYCEHYLAAEFPKILAEKYREQMQQHRLKREIVVTQLTNTMVQYMGIAYVHRMYDEVGASPAMSARAFIAALDLFEVESIWHDIEKLDGQVSAKVQIEMMNEITYFLQHQSRWLLHRYRAHLPVPEIIHQYKADCKELFKLSYQCLNEEQKAVRDGLIKSYTDQGVPSKLAKRVADFYYLYSALDMISVCQKQNISIPDMLHMFYALSQAFGLSWLRNILNQAASGSYWEMLSAASLKDDLNAAQAELVVSVLQSTADTDKPKKRIEAWTTQYRYFVKRWHVLFDDFKTSQQEFFRMVTLLNCLKDLVGVCKKDKK
ncbi:MAG: NAD-glutamate dehydrogenase, partial [Gammaproteobacteria bacterium]|nr:NAD-glutamate dehydrogenase [Gammaproteobacteria bacterium]